MSYKDSVQYRTKTIVSGEYLPHTTNVITTIKKNYNITDENIRTYLSYGAYLGARILQYVGDPSSPSTWLQMGAVEAVNSSRIWKVESNKVAPSGTIKFKLNLTFNRIADTTNFSVVPRDITMCQFEASSESITTSILNTWAFYLMENFGDIYGMQSSEYFNLYGKVQLTNLTVEISL